MKIQDLNKVHPAYIEEKQLARNIGISSSKGKKTDGKNGEKTYVLNDGLKKKKINYWKTGTNPSLILLIILLHAH